MSLLERQRPWPNSVNSDLAASLGDPNFPKILTGTLQGERIVRYQQIFTDYSRLGISKTYDRPIAVDSLQRRLLRAWGVRGGFGVFDDHKSGGLLCRSLLWCRGADMEDRNLEKIKFPEHRSIPAIPSWSWMAYAGSIDYFKPEFGRFDWEPIGRPWTNDGVGSNSVALTAKARRCSYNATGNSFKGHEDMLVFDRADYECGEDVFCAVLGIEKGDALPSQKTHYLLLVCTTNARNIDGLPIYHRIGAGFLQGKFIKDGGFIIAIY